MNQKKVAIIMGSDSDLPVVEAAINQLHKLGIETETKILSAHRTPNLVVDFAKTAKQNGFITIIAAASLSAHLAGIIAAHTTLPVIGIPIKSNLAGGLDSLLSTVQMPPGVPVATMAIDGAKNAAILAAQIIATSNPEIELKLEQMKKTMEKTTIKKNSNLKFNFEGN